METATSKKKPKFAECEIVVLVTEVEHHRDVLIGGLSSGTSKKRSQFESKRDGSCEQCWIKSVLKLLLKLKKRSDIKVKVKHIAAHRQSVVSTGGGQGDL